ncbi:hypothetical protein CCACVL1_05858 [Corchorus capsularis]|uniref:Uncharacterized protein n=1 Tax=Corchorus capsularis TaxID=210143 RepID=A0A1R3JIX5_COCAP|nr:hypothetical protein CCACVL1_05858 [Corchorus capsularis]
MEDVIVSAHRNEHLATSLRSFRDELRAKEPQSERRRKKAPRKDDKATATSNSVHATRRPFKLSFHLLP